MTKSIRMIFIVLIMSMIVYDAYGQDPAAVANFVKPDVPITTTPEFPAFCSEKVGVVVTVNEDYQDADITWTHKLHSKKMNGKTNTLHLAGEWTITVGFTVDGVSCTTEKKIKVFDISDDTNKQKYFEKNGFYPITIFRDELQPVDPVLCRNCECAPQLDKVSFTRTGDKIKLVDGFEDFPNFRPFYNFDYSKAITTNSCLCDGNNNSRIEEFEQALNNGNISLWGHQFFQQEGEAKGVLYFKASMDWQETSPVGEHRDHLDVLIPQILKNNPDPNTTEEIARIIITNLFMSDPIGGFDLKQACDDPKGCYADGNYLTPAGIAIKLPEEASNFIFASADNSDGTIKGALIGMTDVNGAHRAYRYKSGYFAGYYNDIRGGLQGGFETIMTPTEDNNIFSNFPIQNDGECKVIIKETNLITTAETNFGGIGETISDIDPDYVLVSSGFLNADKETVSFLSGNARIISLPLKQLQDVKFVYDIGVGDVENVSSGLLWSFELVNEFCELEKYIFDDQSSYKHKNKVYTDNVNEVSIDNFIYLMNCNGIYGHYGINKGSLLKHDNTGINYTNDFNALTNFFVPFSDQNPDALKYGTANINETCAFCPNDEFSKIVIRDNYCTEPEHIFVEKIAQLATVYPDYFIEYYEAMITPCVFSFTQKEHWEKPITGTVLLSDWWSWSKFLENNLGIYNAHGNDNVLFFKTFLNQMKEESKDSESWWNQDLANISIEEIICHIRGESQNITANVPWDRKLIALDLLYNVDKNSTQRSDAEYAIIHLLAASTDQEVLTHVLSKLLSYYYLNFNSNVPYGQDNLKSLLHLVCSRSGLTYVDMQLYYEDWNALPQLEANIFTFSNLNASVQGNTVKINGVDRPYNQIIPVQIDGILQIGGLTYNRGAILFVPSIIAAMLSRNNTQAVLEREAWIVVDVGLIVVGIGAAKHVFTGASILRRGFIAAELAGSILGLTGQVIDDLTPEERARIQFIALLASGPEIGISLIEVVTDLRLLRNNPKYASNRPVLDAANEVRLALAEKDLKGFPDAWDFVRTNPRGADAWEVLIHDSNIGKGVRNLEKVDGHLAKNIHTSEELETAFKASNNKTEWIDDIGYNVLRKADGKIEYINPNGKVIKWPSQDPNNFPDQITKAINSGDAGRIATGEAAQAVSGQKPLVGMEQTRKLDGQDAAELDIVTADEIIEVKANISLAKDKFPSQIPKLKDSGIDQYVNPRGKPVILHVKEPLPINPNTGTIYPSDQQFIDGLLNDYNIQFSNSLSELTSKIK